jgi:hypothetical protein
MNISHKLAFFLPSLLCTTVHFSSYHLICLSFRQSAWNNWAPTERTITKFDIWVLLKKMSRKFKFHWNLTRIKGTLHEDQYTFLIISRSILLRRRNVSDKSFRENQNTYFVFNNFFLFFFQNRSVSEIMWKIVVERGRLRMTIWRMRIACWITKATNTHSQYVMLIAFPVRQWLHERSTTLLYTYIAFLVWKKKGLNEFIFILAFKFLFASCSLLMTVN